MITNTRLTSQYINGQWRDGSGDKHLIIENPYSGDEIGTIKIASTQDIDEAYDAAQKAQPAWEAMSAYQRRDVFEQATQIFELRREEITQLIVQEAGGWPYA